TRRGATLPRPRNSRRARAPIPRYGSPLTFRPLTRSRGLARGAATTLTRAGRAATPPPPAAPSLEWPHDRSRAIGAIRDLAQPEPGVTGTRRGHRTARLRRAVAGLLAGRRPGSGRGTPRRDHRADARHQHREHVAGPATGRGARVRPRAAAS